MKSPHFEVFFRKQDLLEHSIAFLNGDLVTWWLGGLVAWWLGGLVTWWLPAVIIM